MQKQQVENHTDLCFIKLWSYFHLPKVPASGDVNLARQGSFIKVVIEISEANFDEIHLAGHPDIRVHGVLRSEGSEYETSQHCNRVMLMDYVEYKGNDIRYQTVRNSGERAPCCLPPIFSHISRS